MIPTTTTTSRKRSRPQASRPLKSLSLFAVVLLVAVSQASAFVGPSTSVTSEAEMNSVLGLQKIYPTEDEEDEDCEHEIEDADEDEEEEEGWEYFYEVETVDEDEEEEEGWEYFYVEEEEYEDDDEEYDEEYYHEEYDEEYDDEEYDDEEYDENYDDEDYWAPEELKEMDALYDRYLKEVAANFGANWEEKYDLVVSKEEIYEEYLKFEEQKKSAAEEQRQIIEATHMALLDFEEAVRTEEEEYYNDSLNQTQKLYSDTVLPPRTPMVVLGTKNDGKQCLAKTTIVTNQGGNTRTVIGSI